MKLIKPSIEFIWMTENPLQIIEDAGRTCYKSENKTTAVSAERFVRMLLDRGHEAMLEHASISYRVICDRGVTHEIVRHRLFSYAQESTRYCNYKDGVTFIIPCWLYEDAKEGIYKMGDAFGTGGYCTQTWLNSMAMDEEQYKDLLKQGWSPQQARTVLPNSLKAEIVIIGNLREWRHFFKLRTDKAAHPQMREVAGMLLKDIQKRIPILFEEF